MRRVAAIVASVALCASISSAQVPMTGAGLGSPTTPYTGPGDVVSGANAAYGLRAYTAATRGNKLINACNSTGGSDVACADMVSSASTGFLVSQTIGGITCPGANCTIKTWYDISGATNCSSAACDVTQATVANRAALTASVVGGHACGVFSGTAPGASANSITSISAPYTVSSVSERTGTPSNGVFISNSGGTSAFGYSSTANNAFMYSSNNATASGVTDNAFHAIQYLIVGAGTSDFFYVDGSSSSLVNAGANSFSSSAVRIGGDIFGNDMTGDLCEVLIYPSQLNSTQLSNMNSNQHSAWGF